MYEQQISLLPESPVEDVQQCPAISLGRYEKILIQVSGGKDSIACLLHLLDLGVDRSRIELWHNDIDGIGDSFMDWPVTRAYCKAIADAFGLPIYFSWRDGGFLGEMLRDNSPTGDVLTETPTDGLLRLPSKKDSLGTRLKFPQQSASLSTRYCSSYTKIDVSARAIAGQSRFAQGEFLFVTGERAQESANRAKYAQIEPHRTNNLRRHMTHWRPVLHWSEAQVWEIIERYRVRPHVAYELGLGRVSCMFCIFSSPQQWATVRELDGKRFMRIASYEQQFGVTIRRDGPVTACADKGTALPLPEDLKRIALSDRYELSAIVPPDEPWLLPKGAYGESCGPT